VVAFSPPIAEANQVTKGFSPREDVSHWRVNRMTTKARVLTAELFRLLHDGYVAVAG
jgi:dGTPase